MHSSGDGDEYGDYSPVLQDTPLRFADDILDDILDDGLLDFRCVPLTVPETLLEITLAGPGPEAIRLLETLQGRPMSADQELEVAAEWERQARWLSARQQAANVAFVGATAATSRDGRREQDSRTLELALAVDCNDTFLKAKLATARL
ncbi:MAG: hypothetical protein QOJ83_1999, partial [Frankiales bacterium]|nr:hypothetical protein [Frankiales bacterium]